MIQALEEVTTGLGEELRCIYGSPRVHEELKKLGRETRAESSSHA